MSFSTDVYRPSHPEWRERWHKLLPYGLRTRDLACGEMTDTIRERRKTFEETVENTADEHRKNFRRILPNSQWQLHFSPIIIKPYQTDENRERLKILFNRKKIINDNIVFMRQAYGSELKMLTSKCYDGEGERHFDFLVHLRDPKENIIDPATLHTLLKFDPRTIGWQSIEMRLAEKSLKEV